MQDESRAAVIATSKSNQAVKLRRVVYDDVQQGVDGEVRVEISKRLNVKFPRSRLEIFIEDLRGKLAFRNRRSARIRTRVCGWTPSMAEITRTAPSSRLNTRSTSAMKSGWPGVSIRLTATPAISNDTTADLMVIPRWRSSANVSVCVVPASTLPIVSMTPAACSSRSVSVVLPASTCARIPKFSVPRGNRHTPR